MHKLTIEHLFAYLPYNPKFHLSLNSDRFDSITEDEPWRIAMSLEEAIKGNICGAEKYKSVILTQTKPSIMWEEEQIFLGQMQSNLGYEEDDVFLDEVKLCLRPLSDLTTEIEHNGEKFVPIERLWDETLGQVDSNAYDDHFFNTDLNTTWISSENVLQLEYIVVQKLTEWHFDIFGLREKNLCIYYDELKEVLNEN
jgi:hypothetical protein